MDIGMLKNNTKFYDGFEPEPEVTLTIPENPEFNIHIWEGYFQFIFGSPPLDGKGWNGFTRDYNQMERVFGDDDYIIKNIGEYLNDLLVCSQKSFEDEETTECCRLLQNFLEFALKNNYHILAHVF